MQVTVAVFEKLQSVIKLHDAANAGDAVEDRLTFN